MKPNHLGILTVAAAACLATASLSSQDSASVDKDPNKVVLMQGVFKSIDWTNPAVQVHLDVQNSKGKTEHWVMEGDSPATMLRRGFARDTIQSGQAIIVCGLMPGQSPPARRVAGATLDAGGIALADGRTLYFGRAADNCRQTGASQQPPASAASIAPVVNSPVQPFVNSPVQPFVSAPVTAFGVPPVVSRGAFATTNSEAERPVILQGVIRNVDWTDPQVIVHLEVRNAGRLSQWTVSEDSPQIMLQMGVAKETLKIGESIVVCGILETQPASRPGGAQVLNGGGIAFADGRTEYFGRAAGNCRGTTGDRQAASSPAKPAPVVNSPVQPFVTPPVGGFGVEPRR